ncbi:ABC transporter ATP-binding membrane spanning permease - possible multidrug resistance [Levilactobacillus koreensis JCM 16448]|nr:ABC transporter ATP-binding protein [Levilactobacillus koreensis]KRK86407.1 ABC transporter ATP-binding membrane spanning permease - possible multidrug resistance [Levilactobacillus koreensis JCM 16448]
MRKYIFQHRGEVGIVMFLLMVIEALTVLGSVLSANLLNALIKSQLNPFLLAVGLLMLDWMVIAALNYGASIYQEKVIQNIDISIRQDLADILIDKDYESYNSRGTGVYESWVNNDIQTINVQGLQNFFTVVEGIFGTVFALFTLIAYHWSLALSALILAGLIIMAPKVFDKRIMRANTQLTHQNEAFVNRTQDVMGVFNLLYAFQALRLLKQGIVSASQALKQSYVNQRRAQSSVQVVGFLGNVISQVMLMGLTGILAMMKLVSIGTLSAVSSLSGNIFNNLGNMSTYLGMIRGVAPIFEKFELEREKFPATAEPTEMAVATTAIVPDMIRVRDLSFGYHADQLILRHVNYNFEQGKKYLILGESGGGKSTFLKVLTGYLTNYTGEIRLAGKSLRDYSANQLGQQLLYLDQRPQALTTTVRENLQLADSYSDDELVAVLLATKLCPDRERAEAFLDQNVGAGGSDLSGGQLQRLALARGLLRHVGVILLDEGTSAVDTANAVKIERDLLENPALTLIMISHTPHAETQALFDETIQFAELNGK